MSHGSTISKTAGGAIPKYSLVYISAGKVVVTTAATDIPYGIAQDAAAADGDTIPVLVLGRSKCIATDGSITDGQLLSAVGSGRADSNAGTTGDYYWGTANQDSGAAGDWIDCTFTGAVLQDDGT